MKLINGLFALLLVVGALFWAQQNMKIARASAIENATERLALTRDIRTSQLSSEIKTIYSEIRFWADSKPLREGMKRILQSWDELGDDPKARARQLYITENPLYPNYTADLYKADDGSSYSDSHENLHKLLKGLIKRRGYYDVFLIANNGDVVYSVYKEDDYASNLMTGKYKETTLAKGFREVQENTNLNHVSLYDFMPYAPSNNVPSSFVQTGVISNNNKTAGVLAFQLPTEPISKVIKSTSGLNGHTEVMAIGADYLMRNQVDGVVIKEKIQSSAIDKALKGETGVERTKDYKGKETITAYAPFQFSHDTLGSNAKDTWAIIVKQDVDEILGPAEKRTQRKLLWLAVLALISLLLTWLFTRRKEELSTTEEKDS